MRGIVPDIGGEVAAEGRLALYKGMVSLNYGEGGSFLAFYRGDLMDTLEVQEQTLPVIFGGGHGDPAGNIFYRYGGRQEYASDEMYWRASDTLFYDLTLDLLSARGLECYFVLSREGRTVELGSPDHPYIEIVHVTNSTGQRPDSTRPGRFAIVAVPLDVEGSNSVISVFGDDLGSPDPTKWRLGNYNNAVDSVLAYPDAEEVIPGRGWWLISREPETFGVDGYTVRPNRSYLGVGYYEVPIALGWNQLANPFPFNIDWREVLVDRNGTVVSVYAGLIDDVAYWYSGSGYFWANTLPAWDGFFVFANQPGLKMMFPYREQIRGDSRSSMRSLATATADLNWSLQFTMEADGLTDDGNLVGVRDDARDGLDRFDMAEPPAAPGTSQLAFVLPDDDPYLRRCDIRPPLEDGAAWDMAMTHANERVLTVTGIDDLPNDLEAVLVFDIGTTVILRESMTIAVPFDTRSARLLIGSRNYTASEVSAILPEECQLHQNFPNPFNPVTNLRYTVPEAGHVLLEVFNLLGQRVITLVNDEVSAGTHDVTWNALDSEGRPVATGVYFYRITAGDFTAVRKMLLLK